MTCKKCDDCSLYEKNDAIKALRSIYEDLKQNIENYYEFESEKSDRAINSAREVGELHDKFKTIRTELERTQRMQGALELLYGETERLLKGGCGNGGIISKVEQALSDAPTIKPQYGEWLPIESAPKDGTEIIVHVPHIEDDPVSIVTFVSREFDGEVIDGWWILGDYGFANNVTKWMPKPNAPKEEK